MVEILLPLRSNFAKHIKIHFNTMRKFAYLFLNCFILIVQSSWAQVGQFISADRFSNSIIKSLCQDKYGNIWIATDYGLNKFDGYQFTTYLHDESDVSSLCHNAVVSLFCDRNGHVWVGTNRGLDRYDSHSNSFVHYEFPDGNRPRIAHLSQLSNGNLFVSTSGYGAYLIGNNLSMYPTSDYTPELDENYYEQVYEDSKRRLWRRANNRVIIMKSNNAFYRFVSPVGDPIAFVERNDELLVVCNNGILTYQNGQLVEMDIDMSELGDTDDVAFNVAKIYRNGNIYIGTRGKGLFRLPLGSRRLERVNVDVLGVDLETSKITSMLFDRNDNLWLALERKGLLIVNQQPNVFRTWSFEKQHIQLGSYITSVCEGDKGITWCTVQNVGVYGFDSSGRVVAHPDAPSSVEYIYRDKQKRYWLGTGNGLYAYDPLTGRSQLKHTFDCEGVNEITSDAEGNIYFSVFARGFCSYNPQTGEVKHFTMNYGADEVGRVCNDWVLSMTSDYNGLIWIATSAGVSCYDPKADNFLSQGWMYQLANVMCFSLCELRDGNIAIGTDQGLYLYDRSVGEVKPFPNSEQLKNKIVNYIVQANDGDLWCSTSMGIWQYSANRNRFIGHITGNGLEKKEYLHGVGLHTDMDAIIFGHNDGLVAFSPKQIQQQSQIPADSLMLTSFVVDGVPVNAHTVLSDVEVTERAVSESSEFTLSHQDHTVTMRFSQLNFNNPYNVAFEFRVNGGQWIKNVEGDNTFIYTFMQPGTYDIEARALHGDVYSPVKQITVVVLSPWYSTWWAYTIYFLLISGLAVYLVWIYRRRMVGQLDEEKMKFLINATHDIRSPLTLILSPLANLKRKLDSTQVDALRDIDTIERNANRVLNLVNQILDMRKIDKQQMRLHYQQVDMVHFIYGTYKLYEYNAQEHNIAFHFRHGGIDKLNVWFDSCQFDKVVSNLLSNAFKYTADGGTVEILLSCDSKRVRIEVRDTGVGLEKDTINQLFDRFYQGDNSHRMHINGTGIGLNLCKMIVDMHQGTIEASNRTDGHHGASFVVTLPLGREHLTQEQVEEIQPYEEIGAEEVKNTRRKNQRILIVDDDSEMAHYITSELGQYYKFGICSNGKEALKELLTGDYDLVVSDVMMPEMDGFTLLRMIKSNVNVSHIPVIMLTSKADIGNRLEGLERGADAFLPKPFDVEELRMNIENLIIGRQRLKGKYSGAQQQADKVEVKEVKGNDELLMERVMKSINKNLSNSDFNVDMLTMEVGISRAQLHRKMKEITGISTSEFIRNIRLEQAARLLREQKINVTQVAYTVGFSNLAHFSTIFRKHFGIAPTEYVENLNSGNTATEEEVVTGDETATVGTSLVDAQ